MKCSKRFPTVSVARCAPSTIGNPVREDIAAAATPQVRFSGRHGAINVLVFGGSQGAVRLNTVVPLALAQLDARPALQRAPPGRGALA